MTTAVNHELDTLRYIASMVHSANLGGITEREALDQIRKQTLEYWHGNPRAHMTVPQWRKPEGYALVVHPEADQVLRSLPEGQWVILQRRIVPARA